MLNSSLQLFWLNHEKYEFLGKIIQNTIMLTYSVQDCSIQKTPALA